MINAKKFKNNKYYEDARKNYTDGLRYARQALLNPTIEEDEEWEIDLDELASTLYSNRAAAELALRNYGSTRSDAARAINYNPKNVKAYYRGAMASLRLRKPEDLLLYSTKGLEIDPENKPLLKLKSQAKQLLDQVRAERERDEFKRAKHRAMIEKYKALCQIRNVKVGDSIVSDERVKHHVGKADLDPEDGQMRWPVLFLYDQYSTSDLVELYGENDMFVEHLANMFPEDGPFAPWDERHEYVASKLAIYVGADAVVPYKTDEDWQVGLGGADESEQHEEKREDLEHLHSFTTDNWIKVSPFKSLNSVLSRDDYVVPGIPMIHIFVSGSETERRFLSKIKSQNIAAFN
jgi:tetratricopeptide (TPR) repeat protein